jgi:hypothetical protein
MRTLNNVANLINVSGPGTVDIAGLNLVLNVTGTQTQTEYVIANSVANSANILGSAFKSTNLPAGWSIDYDGTLTNPNAIVALVPEPASLTLLLLCGGGLLARRRR